MESLAIRYSPNSGTSECPLCQATHDFRTGPLLVSGSAPVCRACGKKSAAAMLALVDLAQTAEQVGKRTRHLLTPPMESLLELARAAENYTSNAPRLGA